MTTLINGRHTGLAPSHAAGAATPGVDYAAARRIQDEVNARLDAYAREHPADGMDRAGQRQLAMHLIAEQLSDLAHQAAGAGRPVLSDAQEDALSQAVLAAMFGLGRFEQLLTDPQVEEIFISGSSPATLRFADGHTETAQPVAESDEDLLDQLRSIATYHGQSERAVTSTRPFLDLRLPDGSRLAAVWAVTPHPEVTIRRHRFTTVTLDELTGMGMVSPAMAAFLTAAVQARRSVLIVGSPGAGKTTLLRALAQCLPVSERFATMETEHELLLHEIEGRFPLLVPYEARPGTGELDAAGRPAGEVSLADIFPTSLRHGLQRILVGEVRGAEVIPMLAAMSRGYRGSMATFHADSARDTFEALASLLGEHKPNWNHAAAMAQIATALDLIVYVDTAVTATGATARFVSDVLEVGRVGENGQPAATAIFAPSGARPGDPRGYPAHLPENTAWCVKAGLDLTWLTDANGTWPAPFPTPTGGGGAMTGPGLWAAVAGAAAVGGVLLIVAGIRGTRETPRRPGGFAAWRARLRGMPARRLRTWGLAVAAGLVVWAVSGWPVAGLVTAAAIPGLPYFFSAGRIAQTRVDRLQGLEEWVRRLADAMAAGAAPTQTIVASATHAPAAIAEPVGRLAGALASPRRDRDAALRAFADGIDDPLGDMVTFALHIAITAPSARVPDVLRGLAQQLADDVAARRRVETDRAEPRSEARTIVIVQIAFVIVVCAATSYTVAYDSFLGQLVLAALAAVVVGALWMLRRLSLAAGPPRLITAHHPAASHGRQIGGAG